MATPNMTTQSFTLSQYGPSDVVMSITARDASGAPINISAGYTAKFTIQNPSSQIQSGSFSDLTGNTTFTYGANGVLGIDVAKSAVQGLPGNVPIGVTILLSNDAFATASLAGVGTMLFKPSPQ